MFEIQLFTSWCIKKKVEKPYLSHTQVHHFLNPALVLLISNEEGIKPSGAFGEGAIEKVEEPLATSLVGKSSRSRRRLSICGAS